VMFFRWRPAHFGAEIYWMGIIDHDDIPRRRYDEAKQFAGEINGIKDHILGTHVRMDVGIAGADFDNQEAHRTYPIGLPSPHEDALLLHRHCYRAGIACGYIHPEDDLSPLKVLYVPHWLMWQDGWTARIEDANNHIIRSPAPGRSLSALAGVTVEEFGRLTPTGTDGLFPLGTLGGARPNAMPAESAQRRYTIKVGNHEVTAAHMYELLDLGEGVESIGTWSNRFAAGQAAATSRQVGKGRVVYVGTYLTEDLVATLMADLIAQAGVEPLLPNLPKGVEVTVRESNGTRLMFILNTTDGAAKVSGIPAGTALVADAKIAEGIMTLPGYGCVILKLT
jgi:beta-galactosidase